MARWWGQGPVKTRLAATIGQPTAREIYRQMVESLWSRLAHPDLHRHLWATPAAELSRMALWLPGADAIHAQTSGDLGARMAAAFHTAFTSNSPWAAVVGTDAPRLDAAWVLAAGAQLEQADVVMTPTEDGGYALLAMKRLYKPLFTDMPWSTEAVAVETRRRAAQAGLVLVETETVRDLDDAEDLAVLRAEGLLPAGIELP